MDLAVESPLSPMLANAITHDHPRHVGVRAMVPLVGPTFDDRNAYDLHVEQLRFSAHTRHVSNECLTTSPRSLRVFREHAPHLLETSFGMKSHETPLKGGRRHRESRGRG